MQIYKQVMVSGEIETISCDICETDVPGIYTQVTIERNSSASHTHVVFPPISYDICFNCVDAASNNDGHDKVFQLLLKAMISQNISPEKDDDRYFSAVMEPPHGQEKRLITFP